MRDMLDEPSSLAEIQRENRRQFAHLLRTTERKQCRGAMMRDDGSVCAMGLYVADMDITTPVEHGLGIDMWEMIRLNDSCKLNFKQIADIVENKEKYEGICFTSDNNQLD
jgi:hypothetical protein